MLGKPIEWCRILDVELVGLDERALKKAYAQKIKTIDAAADPAAFQEVRAAFEGLRPLMRLRRQPGAKQRAPALDSLPRAQPKSPAPSQPEPDAKAKAPRPANTAQPKPSRQPQSSPESTHNNGSREASAADHKAINELVEKAKQCLKSPWAGPALGQVLNDPLMDQMSVNDRVEFAIGLEIIAFGRQTGKDFQLPPSLNQTALKLLDERFAWFSDVTRLKKKFGPNSQRLLNALVMSPDGPSGELGTTQLESTVAPRQKFQLRRVFFTVLAMPWFASSLFLVALLTWLEGPVLRYLAP